MSWSLRSRSLGSPSVFFQIAPTSSRILPIMRWRSLISADSNWTAGSPGSSRRAYWKTTAPLRSSRSTMSRQGSPSSSGASIPVCTVVSTVSSAGSVATSALLPAVAVRVMVVFSTLPWRTTTITLTGPAALDFSRNCSSLVPPPDGRSKRSVSVPTTSALDLPITCAVRGRSASISMARSSCAVPSVASIALRESRTRTANSCFVTTRAGISAARVARVSSAGSASASAGRRFGTPGAVVLALVPPAGSGIGAASGRLRHRGAGAAAPASGQRPAARPSPQPRRHLHQAEGQPAGERLDHLQLAEVVRVVDRVVLAEREHVADEPAHLGVDGVHRGDVDDQIVGPVEELVDETLRQLDHQLSRELRRVVAVVEELHVEVRGDDVPVRPGTRLALLGLVDLLDERPARDHRLEPGDDVALGGVRDEVLHERPDPLHHPTHDGGDWSGARQHRESARADRRQVGVEVDEVAPPLRVGKMRACVGGRDEDDVVDRGRPARPGSSCSTNDRVTSPPRLCVTMSMTSSASGCASSGGSAGPGRSAADRG